MNHCRRAVFATACLCLLIPAVSHAQKKRVLPTNEKSAPSGSESTVADEAAIRAGSQAFVAAFNKGDAKAVAALWTETGEYVDDRGEVFAGRKAIEEEYATFFKANPGHKIRLIVDSIKLLSDAAALEDGRAMLDPAPPGAPAVSKYVAIHVKVDGEWRMSSVRDTHIETPSGYRHLAPLEWMIGSWNAEEHGMKTEVTCRWVANKSFIERSYSVTSPGGHVTSSGVQMIGWNPNEERFQSWTFASDGGYALGAWSSRENGWAIVTQGTMATGAPMSAVTLFTRLDDNGFSWQSVSRTAAGTALPDLDEIVLKRVTK